MRPITAAAVGPAFHDAPSQRAAHGRPRSRERWSTEGKGGLACRVYRRAPFDGGDVVVRTTTDVEQRRIRKEEVDQPSMEPEIVSVVDDSGAIRRHRATFDASVVFIRGVVGMAAIASNAHGVICRGVQHRQDA